MHRRDLTALKEALAIRHLQQQSAQAGLAAAQIAHVDAQALRAQALAARADQEQVWKAGLRSGSFNLDLVSIQSNAVLRSDVECAWFDRRLQEAGRHRDNRAQQLRLANANLEACEQWSTLAARQADRFEQARVLDAIVDQTAARALHEN